MTKRLLLPRSQAVGLDGRPLAGAKLYTYTTGTSTPKPVFTDAALTIPHANPVIADAAGRFPAMFLGSGDYRTILTDAADVVIATDDPVEGDDASTAPPADQASALLAARRNRLVNPAMQISQQFGTANTDITTGSVYALDQWGGTLSTTPGGTLRLAQVASTTPAGSPFRLRATVQATDVSIAAGDLYVIEQPLEGQAMADARFGTATARQLLLRLGVRSSVAGTFGVSISNAAGNRSWVGLLTIAAGETNTDVVRTFTIPGDVSGTWPTTTALGMVLRVALAAGVSSQGATGWQTGSILTTAAQTNLMATGSATFDLFDAGLYVDTAGLGLFPPFEVPDPADELRRCQRYYETGRANFIGSGHTANAYVGQQITFTVQKRAVPIIVMGTATENTNLANTTVDQITVDGFRHYGQVTAAGNAFITRPYVAGARM
ncbi:MAG: hypothetical protein ABFC67_01530 [Mizugakiibacter sp.]|uniref:hypothetical protein n=1 Tax=Mizugakiibacter sp. TaxID=1972610 RepID=UPI00320D7F61